MAGRWWEWIAEGAAREVAESPAGQALLGGDLGATAADRGYTLDLSGGGAYAPSDPDVFMGGPSRLGRTGSPDTQEAREAVSQQRVMPRSAALGSFYGWGRDDLEEFQRQAVAAGLIDEDQVRYGVRDAVTYSIWQGLVDQSADAYSVGVRLAPMDLLGEYMSRPVDRGPERQPFTAVVSNPDDLEREIREGFKEAIGSGKVPEERLRALVAKMQGMERAAQRAEYDAAETGGEVVRPPSMETFIEEEAQRENPAAFDAHKFLDRFSVVADMLGGR